VHAIASLSPIRYLGLPGSDCAVIFS